MRIRLFLIIIVLAFSAVVHASSSLRIGNRLLVVGDSRERVTQLLGRPTSRTHRRKHAAHGRRGGVRVIDNNQGGEQWRYRRGNRVTVVTLVDGRVTDIEDDRL